MVIATQNPIEHEGTYPLPEAQLDRFMMRIAIGYPSAEVEAEIAELPADEQPDYLGSLGLTETARARFLRAVYALLHQISFFTVGEDEVRAWTVRKGDRAVRAAGKIHSDLEKNFVRAEVVHYEDFIAAGSEHRARETGKLRLEGKDYVVQDGDILHVRAGGAKR